MSLITGATLTLTIILFLQTSSTTTIVLQHVSWPLPPPPPLPRYTERANLEIQLFNIQTKLRAAKQKTWYPPEGKLVSDINKVGVAHSHIVLNKHTVKPDSKPLARVLLNRAMIPEEAGNLLLFKQIRT